MVPGLGLAGAGYYLGPSPSLPLLAALSKAEWFVGVQMDFYHLKLPLIDPSLNEVNRDSSVPLIKIQYLVDCSYF